MEHFGPVMVQVDEINTWTADQTLNDDIALKLGTGGTVKLQYETADANANALILVMPEGGATDVPVFVIGDASIDNVDLAFFNGVTEPTIAILNDAKDAYASLDAGDDAVAGSKGLYFKAAADEDIELINLSVTGTPRVLWDESVDGFGFNKSLWVTANDITRFTAYSYVANANGPIVRGQKARGTEAAPTAVLANDDLLLLDAGGHDGTAMQTQKALIIMNAAENWGATAMGTYIQFYTTPIGSTTVAEKARLTDTGSLLIGDTTNANMTVGVTIKQTTGLTNQIMCFKHADLNVPMTLYLESDDFGKIHPTGTDGGLTLVGASTAGRTTNVVQIQAFCGATAAGTTKSTSGVGLVNIEGYVSSGTTVTAPGADQNILSIRSGTTTRFIFDADGDSHQDVGTAWTNFDAYDDPALLQDLRVALSNPDDPIKQQFHEFVNYNKESMERAKLVTFNDDGHNFVNMSRLAMLHTSAIVQMNRKIEDLKSNIALLAKPDVSTLTEGRN